MGFGKSPDDEGAYCNDQGEIEKKVALAMETECHRNMSSLGGSPGFYHGVLRGDPQLGLKGSTGCPFTRIQPG